MSYIFNALLLLPFRLLQFLSFVFVLPFLSSHFSPNSSDPALSSIIAFLLWTPNFYVQDLFLILNLFLFTDGISHEMFNVVPPPHVNARISIWLLRVREMPLVMGTCPVLVYSRRRPWLRSAVLVFQKKKASVIPCAASSADFSFIYILLPGKAETLCDEPVPRHTIILLWWHSWSINYLWYILSSKYLAGKTGHRIRGEEDAMQRGSRRRALRTTDTLGSWEEGMTRVKGLNPYPSRKSL